MTRLYDLAAEHRRIEDAIDADDEQERDVALAMLARSEMTLAQKVEGVAHILRGFEADAEVLRAEEARLAARRKASEANRERLRTYLTECMIAAGLDRVRTATMTAYLQTSSARVEVTDLASVPPDFIRIKREVDRAKVLATWKQEGLVPDGIEIIDGSKHVRIR